MNPCPQRRNHSYDKPEYRDKQSEGKIGAKNGQWKGDDVGYISLHEWVRNRKQKPEVCEHCKTKKPLDLANETGTYTRNLDDWNWYCRSCHMKLDGRLTKLQEKNKSWRKSQCGA